MLFTKIKYSESAGVELQSKITVKGGATEARTFTCAEPPLPELPMVDYKRSTRDAYLQRLSTRKLVESVGAGEVRASATLFEE